MEKYSPHAVTAKSIRSVQAGRAFAAIFVMLFHMNTAFFGSKDYFNYMPFGRIFNFGHSGVDFFFVLSGFIIMKAHRRDIGRPFQFISYIYKRSVRIYPIYFVVLLPWLALGIFLSGTHRSIFLNIRNIIASIALLPIENPHETVLTVAWTLYHEVFFYIIFSTLIINKKFGTFCISVMALASVYGVFDSGETTQIFLFFCDPLHINFVLGIFLAIYLKNSHISRPIAVFIGGTIGFFVVAAVNVLWLEEPSIGMSLLYGLTSAVSLAGAISAEDQGKLRVPTSIFDLGNASYALYLIHIPAISLICKSILRLKIEKILSLQILFALCAIFTVYFSILLHRKIEQPLLRFFQIRMPKRWLAPGSGAGSEANRRGAPGSQ